LAQSAYWEELDAHQGGRLWIAAIPVFSAVSSVKVRNSSLGGVSVTPPFLRPALAGFLPARLALLLPDLMRVFINPSPGDRPARDVL